MNWKTGAVAAVCLVAILVGIMDLTRKAEALTPAVATSVAVARVIRTNLTQVAEFDAEFRPFQEIDLHAKVAGFLKEMRVDIGDRVREGQALATIEVPELQDEMAHARATLRRSQESVKRSQAEYHAAHLAYTRLTGVEKSSPNLVAQQDLDMALAKDQSSEAALGEASNAVDIARADLSKLTTLESYTRITAPFSGVITKRYADPGALIPGGTTSSQITPLLHLSENHRLRLAFPVSVSYVSCIHTGQVVQVHVQALGKEFPGTVSRFSRNVDMATRTMDVEVDVENANLLLVPGVYASISLQLAYHEHALAVPLTAVSRKGSPTVYVVTKDNRIEERKVKLGLETPTLLEVVQGLKDDELVMVSSRTQVHPGQKVGPNLIDLARKP